MEISVYSKQGDKVDTVQLDEKKFGMPIRTALLRDTIAMYEANRRQGTASTKTKAEVAGGGKKPWTQKHTGRARAGSIRSPLWKGGGIVFGPKPRDYSYTIPKKAKKSALYSAIAVRARDNELIIVNDFQFDAPKTKEMASALRALGVYGESCLIVLPQPNETIWKSARNIPYVKVMASASLNAYEVLKPKKILLMRGALEKIQ